MNHVDEVPYEHYIRLLSCVQTFFAYTLGDRSMCPMALQELAHSTLLEAMGPTRFAAWLDVVKQRSNLE
jgi:hypothetical protein